MDAGVYIRIEQFGCRTHPRSFDVKLRGSSNRAPMFSYTESLVGDRPGCDVGRVGDLPGQHLPR